MPQPPVTDRPHIGVVSLRGDLHADLVAHRVRELGGRATVLRYDDLPGRGGLVWTPERPGDAVVATDEGPVAPSDLDLIWWRRLGRPPAPDSVTDADARTVVTNENVAGLLGLLRSSFRGVWVSEPDATRRAELKMVQLRAAIEVGLRVPRTLVSQDPAAVRAFVSEVGGRAVVKTLAGALDVPLGAGVVTPQTLPGDESIALAPAIYQEVVPGERHLRACAWGDDVHCGLIESSVMDWRIDPAPLVRLTTVDHATAARLQALNDHLGLAMGISDLKPAGDGGPPYWLEVNPQGQFLFLEGLGAVELAAPFAGFLLGRAQLHRQSRSRAERGA